MLSGLEARDWLLRFTGEEISNLDAIGLSNCAKLSDELRITLLRPAQLRSKFSLERAII